MTDVPAPARTLRRRLVGLVGWVLLAILAFYLWPSQWGGGTTYVVVRGTSMQPNYHTGDIVIARAADEYEVGDVVVYAVPDKYNGAGKLIMHRLKEIHPNGQFIIQGDNRDSPDDFEVYDGDVVGVERWHIPKVGLLTQVLGRWWFIAGLVALFALLKLWPDDEEDEDALDGAVVAPALTSEPDRPADPEGRRRFERRRGDRRGTEPAEAPPVEQFAAPAEQLVPPLETAAAVALPTQPAPTIDEAAPVEALAPVEQVEPTPVPVEAVVPAEELAPVIEEPPVRRPPQKPRRAQVVVDGDGLASAGWPEAHLDFSRQLAIEAAEEIGKRFGTQVALVFPADVDGLEDRDHAHVTRPDDGESVASVVRARAAGREGLTVLVVTDAVDIADEVWSHGGSVMRCAAWLALAGHVGPPVA